MSICRKYKCLWTDELEANRAGARASYPTNGFWKGIAKRLLPPPVLESRSAEPDDTLFLTDIATF